MSLFRVTAQAEADLRAIWLYIAEDNLKAADRLIDAVNRRYPVLAGFPALGRPRDEIRAGVRSLAVGNYVIYYRRIRGGVEILRVIHGARDVERLFATDDAPY